MRKQCRGAASIVAALLATACSGDPGGPAPQWTVIYRLTVVSGACVVMDSVKYDDGTGTLVKVTSPDSAWSAGFARPSGSLGAQAWGSTCGAANVKLKATWALSGISGQADSSVVTPSAPGNFSLLVPPHTF